jgi:hypothetical protein
MTFAEKLKLQENQSSEEVPEQVQEQVEEVKPKKARTRKPRERRRLVEVVPEVEGGAEEKPKRKPRKKKGEDVVEGGSVEPEKPEKVKRPPSAYNLFVKEAYKSKDVQKLPPKERFAKVAELWHKEKGKSGK